MTRTLEAPPVARDRGDHLALLPQNHEMVGSPITSRAQQDVLTNMQPRTDQADQLMAKHGFPSADNVLSMHPAAATDTKSTASADAVTKDKPADAPGLAVADTSSPQSKTPTTENTFDVQHNSAVVGERAVVSTLGTDTAIVASSDTTTIGTKTADNSLDAVDSRASLAPLDRGQQQQTHQPEHQIAPPAPRADIVG